MQRNLNDDGQIANLDLEAGISMPSSCQTGGLGNGIMLVDDLPGLMADDGVNFL
jgi:hypothetical protein